MTAIDQDVERVNAVHAKLAGPLKVWVRKFDCQDQVNHGVGLFVTKAAALANFAAFIVADFGCDDLAALEDEDDEMKAHIKAELLRCETELATAGHTETDNYVYDLAEVEVRTE